MFFVEGLIVKSVTIIEARERCLFRLLNQLIVLVCLGLSLMRSEIYSAGGLI